MNERTNEILYFMLTINNISLLAHHILLISIIHQITTFLHWLVKAYFFTTIANIQPFMSDFFLLGNSENIE